MKRSGIGLHKCALGSPAVHVFIWRYITPDLTFTQKYLNMAAINNKGLMMATDTNTDTAAKPIQVPTAIPKTALEKLDDRIKQLADRRALIVSRETTEQRKLRNRKCAILGGWLLANDVTRVAEIVASLARAQDRAVFGLEPLPVPVVAPVASPVFKDGTL